MHVHLSYMTCGSAMFGCLGLGSMFQLPGCYQFPCLTEFNWSFQHLHPFMAVSAMLPWQHDGMTHLFILKMSRQKKVGTSMSKNGPLQEK